MDQSLQKNLFRNYQNTRRKKNWEKKNKLQIKDWGISRQRYWGCPIPIAYDENNKIIKIPEENLPVMLPDEINFNTTGNPLDSLENWKKYCNQR